MVALAFDPSRGWWIFQFEVNLVYGVSSSKARATKRNSVEVGVGREWRESRNKAQEK